MNVDNSYLSTIRKDNQTTIFKETKNIVSLEKEISELEEQLKISKVKLERSRESVIKAKAQNEFIEEELLNAIY